MKHLTPTPFRTKEDRRRTGEPHRSIDPDLHPHGYFELLKRMFYGKGRRHEDIFDGLLEAYLAERLRADCARQRVIELEGMLAKIDTVIHGGVER